MSSPHSFLFTLYYLLVLLAIGDSSAFKPQSLKTMLNEEPLNIRAPWTPEDFYCINILTPPPNTILVPYYRVYIRWVKDSDCHPTSNLTDFLITLYYDPKSFGSSLVTYGSEPKITSKWSQPIASNVESDEFLWTVPLIKSDNEFGENVIKNSSLFYIRIETNAMVDEHMRTVFGVTGPLTIWDTPGKENKTLFAPPKETLKAQELSSSNGSKVKIVKNISPSCYIVLTILFMIGVAFPFSQTLDGDRRV
ncbi:5724_t:CDS:1 [Acaulospora colombiana]|uniref:5724_t:CDS:1 n=1 Tax=Acaulospora colombiana TaxID=27376 RepID=A0ACA9LAP1_9GLOM|nr:5724_t:CDS:1 [Acaulospora colombiana]